MKKYLISFSLVILSVIVFAQKKTKKTVSNINQIGVVESIAPTSAKDRLNSFEIRKSLSKQSLVKNLEFRNVGPTVMSGRVVDIDANPDNPTEFYVAYASGGLWKTINNGQSFEPLFDHESVMTIGDIAVDWKNNIIWLGSGENNASRSSYSGDGIYKSTDGGKSWANVGLHDSHHIGRIMLHPSDPNQVWIAAAGHLYSSNEERGVFKTNDGGKSWKKTLYINDQTSAIDLKIDNSNPSILYASMWRKARKAWNFQEAGEESGIFKSLDGGETWSRISTSESGFPQGKGNGRIGLALYPGNTNIIYAIMDNQAKRSDEKVEEPIGQKLDKKKMSAIGKEEFLNLDNQLLNEYLDEEDFPEKYTATTLKESVKQGKINVRDVFLYTHNDNDDLFDIKIKGAEVYKSVDAGKTWTKTHEKNLDGLYYTYGYYFGQIWVAPSNPEKVVIVGVPVVKSENGGKTFENIERENVHSDHHALWINPKNENHYILGNDGGINITYDNGKTWFKANSLPVGQFYAVTYDMEKPYNVYGGLQDNGVWTGPSTNNFDFNYGIFDEGDGFKFLLGGDGMQVQVDHRDNNTVYSGFQFGNYFRINKATGEKKYLEIPREIGEEQFRFNWESPIHLSKHNQDILYFGSHKFHRSLDKGDSFKTLSGDLTRGKKEGNVPFGTLSTIEESPLKFGLIYVGSDDGLVHVSKDGGYNWEKIADKPGLWVSSVIPSSHKESRVYVTFNGYREDNFASHLMVSNDYGKSWEVIGKDLPIEPINVMREDPVNEKLIYVGTDHGLYISTDGGASFFCANNKTLPNVAIHDLQIHPRENELILGTHGRSIFIAGIKELQKIDEKLLAKSLELFDVKEVKYNKNWGKLYSSFQELKTQKYPIRYFSNKDYESTISIISESGLVLKKINDSAEKGINIMNYDLTVNPESITAFEKELSAKDKKDVKIKLADDKKYYLMPGKYKVVLESGADKLEKEFVVSESKKDSKRGKIPSALNTPGEFEEWYEDQGFENTKK
jgi:photosystem II stability/assembly factor-like uncharacterized protein